MRKILLILLTFILTFSLTSCMNFDPLIDILVEKHGTREERPDDDFDHFIPQEPIGDKEFAKINQKFYNITEEDVYRMLEKASNNLKRKAPNFTDIDTYNYGATGQKITGSGHSTNLDYFLTSGYNRLDFSSANSEPSFYLKTESLNNAVSVLLDRANISKDPHFASLIEKHLRDTYKENWNINLFNLMDIVKRPASEYKKEGVRYKLGLSGTLKIFQDYLKLCYPDTVDSSEAITRMLYGSYVLKADFIITKQQFGEFSYTIDFKIGRSSNNIVSLELGFNTYSGTFYFNFQRINTQRLKKFNLTNTSFYIQELDYSRDTNFTMECEFSNEFSIKGNRYAVINSKQCDYSIYFRMPVNGAFEFEYESNNAIDSDIRSYKLKFVRDYRGKEPAVNSADKTGKIFDLLNTYIPDLNLFY